MERPTVVIKGAWIDPKSPVAFTCAYCERSVGAGKVSLGAVAAFEDVVFIAACGYCGRPTFFDFDERQSPAPILGAAIDHLPKDVNALYEEARACALSSPTACLMACRTIITHVAVEKGADEKGSFQAHVDHLQAEHWIPPGGKAWVDWIRQTGNNAVHKLQIMTGEDAAKALRFTAHLLRNVYELPGSV